MTIRITIADDHQLIRQALRALLEKNTQFHVVAEASDGVSLLSVMENTRPDVVLLDVMMPNMNGLEAIEHIRHLNPETHVIMLTMHADEIYIAQAFVHGAQGYLLKGSNLTDLESAIYTVMKNELYLSPSLTHINIDTLRNNSRPLPYERYEMLTPREREVFKLVVQGMTSGSISEQLSISVRTVEIHRANLKTKLGLNTQTELIQLALQLGVITPSNHYRIS